MAQFRPMGCVDGAVILVQGSEATPYEVNGQIEYFLEGFSKQLSKMTDKFFLNLKQGAVSMLTVILRLLPSATNQSLSTITVTLSGRTSLAGTSLSKRRKLQQPPSIALRSMNS